MNPTPDESPASSRLGVLLVNTGTPRAATTTAVRQFLRRFLSDPRVIELPRLLWLPLLHGLVLPLRSPRSARKYHEIWLEGGSPLFVHMQALGAALQRELVATTGVSAGAVVVETAYLYSEPSVEHSLVRLRARGVTSLVVLPAYPQASGTTTGAVFDQVARVLSHWRAFPELRLLSNYHAAPPYIDAVAASLNDHWRVRRRDSHLLMSFHGIPTACVTRGDHYADECRASAALLAGALALSPQDWSLSFQSRFGANRWLGPATNHTLATLPRRGVRAVTVICPGFSVDCLETLEEIAIAGRAIFLGAGGEHFDYVPALNAHVDHARALTQIILKTTEHVRPLP